MDRHLAVRAGIEPAEDALTVRPVYQHTSLTVLCGAIGVAPNRIFKERYAHVRLAVRQQGIEPRPIG